MEKLSNLLVTDGTRIQIQVFCLQSLLCEYNISGILGRCTVLFSTTMYIRNEPVSFMYTCSKLAEQKGSIYLTNNSKSGKGSPLISLLCS